MATSGAALEHIIVERDMPKGYTWVKVFKCWTSDPEGARFFAPKVTDFGDELPAAYFTSVLCFDREAGWSERNIKFIGTEAEAAFIVLKDSNQVALVSCQGHLVTTTMELEDGRSVARSTIMVKLGSTVVHEVVPQGHQDGLGGFADHVAHCVRSASPIPPAPSREAPATALAPATAPEPSSSVYVDPESNIPVWPGLVPWPDLEDDEPADMLREMDDAPF